MMASPALNTRLKVLLCPNCEKPAASPSESVLRLWLDIHLRFCSCIWRTK